MKRPLVVVAVLAVAGLAIAASGILPLAASSGHWAPTEWLLQFVKRRSIATHALGVDAIVLDEPWLVLKGAGHYETACRPCHGSPELRRPRVAAAMLPPPPYLADRLDRWSQEELFYIVKHGIKLTGMPAWPAPGRDDEVRAMVAFLLELRGLDAAGYRRLVHGEAGESRAVAPMPDLEPSAVAATCARCHGMEGRGRGNAAFPAIAGQPREYFRAALLAYARGERHSGIMQPVAAALTEAEIDELAAWYARFPARGQPIADPAAVERGRRIATEGIAARRVPACAECHGPAGKRRRPDYPRLDGQYAEYLVLQLQLFARDRRGGSPYAHLMRAVAPRLTAQDMLDVAAYYASLGAPE